jgi:hypothetical protein
MTRADGSATPSTGMARLGGVARGDSTRWRDGRCDGRVDRPDLSALGPGHDVPLIDADGQ